MAPASEDRWILGTLDFITDTVYAGATQAAMMRYPDSKAFSYIWGRPNPVLPARRPRIAVHCTDMIYTTGLYLDDLPDGDRQLSHRMVERWIQFAYGSEPWKSRHPDGYELTIPDDGTEETREYVTSQYRRVEAQEYIVRNIDVFGAMFRQFLEG